MNKRDARRNFFLAGILMVMSVLMTLFGLGFIRFFMDLPR